MSTRFLSSRDTIGAMPAQPTFRSVLGKGFRLIGRFIKLQPWSFSVAIAGAILFAGSILAAARVVGWITDEVIFPTLDGGAEPAPLLKTAVLLVFAVAGVKAVGIMGRRVGAGWMQLRNAQGLRFRVVNHILRMDMDWYSKRPVGDMLSVVSTDVAFTTRLLAPLPFSIASLILLVGSSVQVLGIDPILGSIVALFLVSVVALQFRASWVVFQLFAELQETRGQVAAIAYESFDGALTVKSLGREAEETSRLEERSGSMRDQQAWLVTVQESYRSAVRAVPSIAAVVIVTVGALRVLTDALTLGDVVSVTYLLSLLFWPIQLVGFVIFSFAASTAGWDRVAGILDADAYVSHGQDDSTGEGSAASVEVADVSFSYVEGESVLAGLNLDVPSGRVVAIVGPTASGKTTLAVLLARLWDPRSGVIKLDRRDLAGMSSGVLPDEMAYASQDTYLFDDTVRGNITLGLEIADADVTTAIELANASEFVDGLPDGIETRIGERAYALSGGQRQRIALARALVRRPRLLILDDATSAVDPTVETAILRGLRSAELPSTVVIIAYRSSSISLSDEVFYIDGGSVVARGTHEELLATEAGYATLLTAYESAGEGG
jgi:ATP-binding cassette subfamily B protein